VCVLGLIHFSSESIFFSVGPSVSCAYPSIPESRPVVVAFPCFARSYSSSSLDPPPRRLLLNPLSLFFPFLCLRESLFSRPLLLIYINSIPSFQSPLSLPFGFFFFPLDDIFGFHRASWPPFPQTRFRRIGSLCFDPISHVLGFPCPFFPAHYRTAFPPRPTPRGLPICYFRVSPPPFDKD